MDFWDVAKLMWRRWYLTVPAILLTAAAGLWVAVNVSPDHQATGHIAVVGPAIQRTNTDSTVTRVNPWSAEALADAATIQLQGKALADELKGEGLRGEWSAVVTGRLPVVRLEVVAPEPEQAQATLQRLREVIDEEVSNRQAQYNIPPEEQITTVNYDGGETLQTVTGTVKRALIMVVGAGLILTIGVVVAFDALVRRRRSKPAAGAAVNAPDDDAGTPSANSTPRGPAGASASATVPVAGRPVAGRPVDGATGDAGRTYGTPAVQVNYSPKQAANGGRSDRPTFEPRSQDDSTIVLPLSNVNVGGPADTRNPSTEVQAH